MNTDPPLHQALYSAPFGQLSLLASENALIELRLPRELNSALKFEAYSSVLGHPILDLIIHRLDAYFSGAKVCFQDLPLSPHGTAFQQSVWRELNKIPYGETASYSDIARAINNEKAVRAIGGAMRANPIAILLPCHRVIGKNRSLTGFSAGLTIKKALLTIEKISYAR